MLPLQQQDGYATTMALLRHCATTPTTQLATIIEATSITHLESACLLFATIAKFRVDPFKMKLVNGDGKNSSLHFICYSMQKSESQLNRPTGSDDVFKKIRANLGNVLKVSVAEKE